jgi:hypothetical protein
MEQLQSTPSRDDDSIYNNYFIEDDDELSQLYSQGVIVTVMGMIQHSQQEKLQHLSALPSVEYLAEMIQRIKLNGFSICDGEFVCYGVGIYSPANFMNHSCNPNALQVFLFEQAKPPSLFVTAVQDVQPGQEICISYTDTSCPTHLRRRQLRRDYFFHCTCTLCCNIHDDSLRMGIKCPDCTTISNVLRVDACPAQLPSNHQQQPSKPHYRCDRCGRTDFEATWKLLNRFEEQPPKDYCAREELEKIYADMKMICHGRSWYVHEAGERLLQSTLTQLAEEVNNPLEEQRVAWNALKLADELLMAAASHSASFRDIACSERQSISFFLQLQQVKYKAAKLRMFLIPDPHESMKQIEEVLTAIGPYYPPNHELQLGLRASLRNNVIMM